MEYKYTPESHSWLLEEAEQDFCYGAKASTTPLHSATLTPPNSSSTSPSSQSQHDYLQEEWMEVRESLDNYEALDTFNDVILPNDSTFGPNDLFKGLQNIDPITQPPKRITIKLKKVKHPKSSNLSQDQLYQNQSYNNLQLEVVEPTSLNSLLATEQILDEMILQNQFQGSNNSNFVSSPDNFLNSNSSNQQISTLDQSWTLHDVVSSDNANNLLDELLMDIKESDYPSFELQGDSLLAFEDSDMGDIKGNCIEPIEWITEPTEHEVQIESSLFLNGSFSDNSSPTYFIESNVTSSPTSSIESDVASSPTGSGYSSDVSSLSVQSSPAKTRKLSSRSKKQRKPPREKLSDNFRYLRKKEQNKEAAIRYRNKKKEEEQTLTEDVKKATFEQEDLKAKQVGIIQEIKFMKNLLREALLPK